MARKPLVKTANLDDADDFIYEGNDTAQRYLGHDKAAYGFVLFAPEFEPSGLTFILPLNPQSVEMDEESAITITPTQGGGKFVENQGSIFKDIVISGTTGFLPLANFKNKQGPALLQQASTDVQAAASPEAEFAKVSGYDVFHRLRSLFRKYLLIHRTEKVESRRRTFLYWVNLKDNEVWLVEPMSFRTSRASRSPMTYTYNIRLRTLAKGSTQDVAPDKTSLTPGALDAFSQSLATIISKLEEASSQLRSALSFFDQYRNLRSQVLEILSTASSLVTELTAIASGVADVLDLPRSLLAGASASISTVFSGIASAADLVVNVPIDALQGLTTLRQQLDFTLANKDFFAKKWSNSWSAAMSDFNREYGVKGDASSDIDVGRSQSALSEATVGSGENIYAFAKRATGDANRAQEIIILNNLRWPYFAPSADERLPGTVAPGDPVLVPVDFSSNAQNNLVSTTARFRDKSDKDEVLSATSTTLMKAGVAKWLPSSWVGFAVEVLSGAAAGQSRLVVSNDATTLTIDQPWTTTPSGGELFRVYFKRVTVPPRAGIVELLGIDLRVVNSTLTNTWDLVPDSRGDYGLIRGQDNLNQALTVKCLTTQGELLLHPWFGLRPVFGQRGTPETLFRLRLFFEQTLLSDSRIEAVEHLVLTQVRDQYRTEVKLAVKGGLRSRFTSPLV